MVKVRILPIAPVLPVGRSEARVSQVTGRGSVWEEVLIGWAGSHCPGVEPIVHHHVTVRTDERTRRRADRGESQSERQR